MTSKTSKHTTQKIFNFDNSIRSLNSTPKSIKTPHQRIVSQEIEKFPRLGENKWNPSPLGSNHQKAQSLVLQTKKLEEKIRKIEESLVKSKYPSAISTRAQSIDYKTPEECMEVSCSSEDSLNILREQIIFAKNLDELKVPAIQYNLDSIESEILDSSFSSNHVPKVKNISCAILFNSIPAIKLR
jgi:hypothetical protein